MDEYHCNKNRNEKSMSRRRFVKTMSASGAAFFLGKYGRSIGPKPPRSRIVNPYVNQQGKPLVVIVEGTDFTEMLQVGLDTLGGLNKLITDNQDVLINPNCNAVDVYPAISDGSAVASLAEEVVSATSGQVTVGDTGFHSTENVYETMNLEDALSGTGAELIYFQDTYAVRRTTWTLEKPSYLVYSEVYDAPVIINFPCLKRHFLGKMTAALKNSVGTIEGEWASSSRYYLHSLQGEDFLAEIAEVAGLINQELTVVDARSLLIGGGPLSSSAGATILSGVNRLIMGGDILAVDVCCAQLLQDRDPGFSSGMVASTFYQAYQLGLGVKSPEDFEVIYASATDVNDGDIASPKECQLNQNYPNPFNASTLIRFQLKERCPVTLTVYDINGKKVATLLNKILNGGDHSIHFKGNGLPSGRYIYRLSGGQHNLSRSMLLLK